MGKKKTEEPKEEVKKEPEEEEEEEDTQIVKDLKEIDDKYLAIEREYEKAVQELQKRYTEKQQPLLDQRTKVLGKTDEATNKATGTPALEGFWLKAMKNLPALEEHVEEWDEEVLKYCCDVTKSYLDDSDYNKGFKLCFHFVENPFFEHDVLWKEYHLEEESPYTGEINATEIKVQEIDWKEGKNVTVEKVSKKVKGGGAKKAKQKGKEKEEPRDSFFRHFFRNLKAGMPIPDDVNIEDAQQLLDSDDEGDDEQMMDLLLENDYEIGCCVRDQLVPFAVRWYTGEACPEDPDDDFDEDGEEDDDDDDDEEEEEDEDDEPPKAAKGKKKPGKAAAGGKNAEECKQQ